MTNIHDQMKRLMMLYVRYTKLYLEMRDTVLNASLTDEWDIEEWCNKCLLTVEDKMNTEDMDEFLDRVIYEMVMNCSDSIILLAEWLKENKGAASSERAYN